MRVKLVMTRDNKVFGLELVPESPLERKVLHRFWDGGSFGIKVNGFTGGSGVLQLTFADQIGVREDPEMVGQWKAPPGLEPGPDPSQTTQGWPPDPREAAETTPSPKNEF